MKDQFRKNNICLSYRHLTMFLFDIERIFENIFHIVYLFTNGRGVPTFFSNSFRFVFLLFRFVLY